jgi:hypothetical protein
VSDAHCCDCVAEQLDWQNVLGKNMLNPPASPPNPAGAAASVAAIEPPSAEPEQHTSPEEQSAPVLHSFEVPEHEPTATQEADIDGIITIVQHVWPDPHAFDGPPSPPPPPPAPGNNAAKPESGPQATLARRLPSIPRGLAAAAPESSPGLTVLPSSEAPPSGAAVVPEDEEPHAAASASPKNAITPRESRTGDMRISKVGLRPRLKRPGVVFSKGVVDARASDDKPDESVVPACLDSVQRRAAKGRGSRHPADRKTRPGLAVARGDGGLSGAVRRPDPERVVLEKLPDSGPDLRRAAHVSALRVAVDRIASLGLDVGR